jgi:CheY-like chemotaxis protein
VNVNLAGVRILAVDDDADIRDLLRFILEQTGAEVRVVACATEVLDQLEQCLPEVLISDIGMPDIDGYTLMHQIRTLIPDAATIPAIALTAYASEVDQKQALTAGFQLHIAKPVDPEELIRAILNLNLKR